MRNYNLAQTENLKVLIEIRKKKKYFKNSFKKINSFKISTDFSRTFSFAGVVGLLSQSREFPLKANNLL